MMTNQKITRTSDGIPQYDGSPELLPLYREEALQYWMSFEHHKRYLAGPRLVKELSGVAKVAIRTQTLKDPQWLAHPRGVYQLLGYLEQTLSKPSLVEASRFVMKFFYNMGRAKGETMTSWVTRHAEALWEASQALRKVQREYGGEGTGKTQKAKDAWEYDYYQAPSETNSGPFRDDGKLDEEDEDASDSWKDWGSSWQGGWSDKTWKSKAYDPPADWDVSDEIFIPEFLAGFLLLHRSGLDVNEKGNVLAAIRGEFSTRSVGRALREQWSDYDLAKRDKLKGGTALMAEVDHDDELEALLADDQDQEFELLGHDEKEAFLVEQERIEEAYAAIQQQKATLKEARWKQRQIRLGRNFFPPKPYVKGSSSTTSSASSARTPLQCFKCKGPHKLADCPLRGKEARIAEEAAEIAFVTYPENVEAYAGWTEEESHVVHPQFPPCMGVIDSGATASLGSAEALEKIMAQNLLTCGSSHMTIDTDHKPVFKFGNGARRQCISTVKMRMAAGDKDGNMEIHVHDTPGQPILVSRRALRSLGAVLDFAENKIIYKKVDPKVVVDLEEAPNGHLLMPLTGNLLERGRARTTPFTSLDAE